MNNKLFLNPFRPGAGHPPPYLAGRKTEKNEFLRLLEQEVVLDNLIITGLRGVGKTVLLESFKPLALQSQWTWIGADISEAVSITEEHLCTRLLTDLSIITSDIVVATEAVQKIGFIKQPELISRHLNFDTLSYVFKNTPGLNSDKLKAVLELVWHFTGQKTRGLIFAYDEAQNLSDQSVKEQYPLSLLLDVFQSLQRKNIPIILVLTGLPTLFPRLVDCRTYTERMFRVLFLDRLSEAESIDAIQKPIQKEQCPVHLSEAMVKQIVKLSGGYPYFIQFICREVYDYCLQRLAEGEGTISIPIEEIIRKLDTDFFSGRWSRATDRQRELLTIIANLDENDDEFTVQAIVGLSRTFSEKPFGNSHVNRMLLALSEVGLVYKNRRGSYSFAVPLLGSFIRRQKLTQ